MSNLVDLTLSCFLCRYVLFYYLNSGTPFCHSPSYPPGRTIPSSSHFNLTLNSLKFFLMEDFSRPLHVFLFHSFLYYRTLTYGGSSSHVKVVTVHSYYCRHCTRKLSTTFYFRLLLRHRTVYHLFGLRTINGNNS